MSEQSWFDRLSEILNQPLPGTEEVPPGKAAAPGPVSIPEDEDDDSILDRITDILTQPLPGTEAEAAPQAKDAAAPAPQVQKENPGEAAVKEAHEEGADPVSNTAAASAEWMKREYDRFIAYQEQARKAFAEQQRIEQERFAAYQRTQFERMMRAQERERRLFSQHQQARYRAWQQQLRQAYQPPPGAPPGFPPGVMPPPPPPPPPWWRR